jgi:hypothetical protein
MTIVRLGSPILQVPWEQNRQKYLEKLWVQMESLIVYMVERCISEALEVEVSRALGRRAYQPCEQAAFGSSKAHCGRCRSRDRRRWRIVDVAGVETGADFSAMVIIRAP